MNTKILSLIVVLVFIFALAGCVGRCPDIQLLSAKIVSGVDEKLMPVQPTTVFPEGAKKIFCWFQWKNALPDTKITASWHYITDDIPILDYVFAISRKEGIGSVSLIMPENKKLPSGKYTLQLKSNERLLKTLNFSVK